MWVHLGKREEKYMKSLWLFFMLCVWAPVHAATILCLFKGDEGVTAEENEIRWHLSLPLKELGYELVYHDISAGYPEKDRLDTTKGIITWYRSAVMKDAELYVQWLHDQVSDGKKVIALGNFGAFQDEESKAWLSPEQLNIFFHSIGYDYRALWTDQVAQIRLSSLHPLVRLSADHRIFRSIDTYFQYKSLLQGNLNLVIISRRDLADSDSVMAGVSSKGAYAWNPYFIVEAAPGKYQFTVDRKRFIQTAMQYSGGGTSKLLLCLYNSGDGQSRSENEINWYLKDHLQQQGYTLSFFDISRRLPNPAETSDVRALVTWFRSSEMKSARAYLDFLSGMSAQGKKLIVFGSMGAHREKGSDEWLDTPSVNKFYNAVGLDYAGQWTDRPELIGIEPTTSPYIDTKWLGFVKPHYYVQLKPTISTLEPVLSLTRSDIPDGRSVLISRSPFGAYVDSAYLFARVEGEAKPLLKLAEFISDCLE